MARTPQPQHGQPQQHQPPQLPAAPLPPPAPPGAYAVLLSGEKDAGGHTHTSPRMSSAPPPPPAPDGMALPSSLNDLAPDGVPFLIQLARSADVRQDDAI